MKTHLFLFTLGPVQSFIERARKTQDLYAASQILSRLVLAAMKAFKAEFPEPQGNVIFPTLEDDNNPIQSLPNRFIAKIRHDFSDEKLQKKADAIRDATKAAFLRIAESALEKPGLKIGGTPAGFQQQLDNHLEIHWTFKEVKPTFKEAYKALEKSAGAAKNVRPFQQFAYAGTLGEQGRKCSVDGINNALFFRPGTVGGQAPFYFVRHGIELEKFALNPGEGLSAASLVKRFYPETQHFPSTAEVALMADEARLPQEMKEPLQWYKMLFDVKTAPSVCIHLNRQGWADDLTVKDFSNWNDDFDYQMLFEENLTAGNFPNSEQLKLIRLLFRRLQPYFKTKYYAVILFDGDQMGKWLSGTFSPADADLEDFQVDLSKRLSSFGKHARNFLDRSKHNGHTVYSGGDDFLGFVNIHHLFGVMKKLRTDFEEMVNMGVARFKSPDRNMTFSAGIVIAHYKTPFSEVLKKVRSVEKDAKKKGGRNAFCIATLKHSGEIQEAIFKWDKASAVDPGGFANWEALETVVKALDNEKGQLSNTFIPIQDAAGEYTITKKGHFSNTFIRNLTTEFQQLTGSDLHNLDFNSRAYAGLEKALLLEMERLVGRSLDQQENAQKDKARKANLTQAVQQLWLESIGEKKTQYFIHALHIADFITRKIRS